MHTTVYVQKTVVIYTHEHTTPGIHKNASFTYMSIQLLVYIKCKFYVHEHTTPGEHKNAILTYMSIQLLI